MKCAVISVLVALFGFVQGDGNFTFTYHMVLRCKEHDCRNGYSYDTFYKIDPETHQSPGVVFEMHLAILAGSNGHILLSSVPNPEPTEAVYEIVVGGGGNKFTELRRNIRTNAKTSAKTVGILSPIAFRAFFIKISEDGVIEFFKEGESLPVISYSDISPIEIKYFSFAAWAGVEAKFLYDCPPPETSTGDNSISPNSKEVEKKMSNSDRLKQTLLEDRKHMPPGPMVEVNLGFKITSVRYDPFDSKLVTGMAIVTSWTDNSMAWDPIKFNGTTRVTFPLGKIWRPDFFIYNSDDADVLDTTDPALITVMNSGEATFHFQTELTSWCHENIGDYNTWPHDQYFCTVVIGAYEPHEKIKMVYMDSKLEVFAIIDSVITNEWDIVKESHRIVTAEQWNQTFPTLDNESHQSDRMILDLYLTRRNTALNMAVYTPLIVLMTFVLISFWNEPLQQWRVSFYTGATVIICTLLSYFDLLVPVHTVPSILVLYITVLGGVLLALMINVVTMMPLMERITRSSPVQILLTLKWLRILYYLPEMKSCSYYESVNEGFNNQDAEDSGSNTAPRIIAEMQVENNVYNMKQELAMCIDRSLFVIYTVVFGSMLAMHY